MIVVDIPLVLPSMANERLHPMAKAKLVKRQRATTELMLRSADVGGRLRVVEHGWKLQVLLVRVAARPIRDTHDNLPTAFKHVVDAIVAYFGIDDSDPRIEWRYEQSKGREAYLRVEFEVVPVGATAAPVKFVRPTERYDPKQSSESLQKRVERLAKPAVVRHRDDPEVA